VKQRIDYSNNKMTSHKMKKQSNVKRLIPIIILLVLTTSCADKIEIPEISTLPVADTTHNSALCGGIITNNGGAFVTERGVCWGTDQIPTVQDNITVDGFGIGEFESNLTDLLPETEYFVRAYAINSAGIAFGEVLSFVTLKESIDSIYFSSDIQPIFNQQCTGCHNGTIAILILTEGNSYNELVSGGYIDTSNPSESTLIAKLNSGDHKIYISKANLAAIIEWIDQGALNN
jgi:hypothetical protein